MKSKHLKNLGGRSSGLSGVDFCYSHAYNLVIFRQKK